MIEMSVFGLSWKKIRYLTDQGTLSLISNIVLKQSSLVICNIANNDLIQPVIIKEKLCLYKQFGKMNIVSTILLVFKSFLLTCVIHLSMIFFVCLSNSSLTSYFSSVFLSCCTLLVSAAAQFPKNSL